MTYGWNRLLLSLTHMQEIHSKVGCLHLEVGTCSVVQGASLSLVTKVGVRGTDPPLHNFLYIIGLEEGKLYVFEGSHKHVFYLDDENRKMANFLMMDPLTLPHFFAFVGHGYTCTLVQSTLDVII